MKIIFIFFGIMLLTGCANKTEENDIKTEENNISSNLSELNASNLSIGMGAPDPNGSVLVVLSLAVSENVPIWEIKNNGEFYWHGEHIRNTSIIADKLEGFFRDPEEFCDGQTLKKQSLCEKGHEMQQVRCECDVWGCALYCFKCVE